MEGEYSDDTDIHVLFVFILHKRHVATEEGGEGSPFIVRNIEIYTLYIYHTWALNCILSFKPIGPSILALPPFPHFLTLREKTPMPCSVRGFLTFSQNSRINIFFVTRYVSKKCIYIYISTGMATLYIDFVDKLILVLYRQFKDFRLLISLSFWHVIFLYHSFLKYYMET